jgi:hypothetical protein
MSNQPSFRYPFALPPETHPQVANALRSAFNSLSDLNQAIVKLNEKVGAATSTTDTTATTATATSSGSTPADSVLQTISYTLVSTQLNQLVASPFPLLTALAGSVNIVVGWTIQYKPGTIAFTMPDPDNALYMYGVDNTAIGGTHLDLQRIDSGGSPTLALDALTDTFVNSGAPYQATTAGLLTAYQNQGVNLTVTKNDGSAASGELTAGDGSIVCNLFYLVIAVS